MSPESADPPLFKKILAAVDGSENSLSAANAAITLAKKYGAELQFLNVLYTPTAWIGSSQAGMQPVYMAEFQEYEQKEAEKLIAKIKGMASEQGIEAKGEILTNIPSTVQAITDYAASEKIDLIVVGTRGLSGFRKLLIGSVSSGVATHAPCSVLIVR